MDWDKSRGGDDQRINVRVATGRNFPADLAAWLTPGNPPA